MQPGKLELRLVKRKKETKKKLINIESPFKSLNPYVYEINEIKKELEKRKEIPDTPQKDQTGKEEYTFYDAQIATKEELEEEYKKSYKKLENHLTEIEPQLIQQGLNRNIWKQEKEQTVVVENLEILDKLGVEIEFFKDMMSVCISGLLMIGVGSLHIALPIGLMMGVFNNLSNKNNQETNRELLLLVLQAGKELGSIETIWNQLINIRLNSYMLLEINKIADKIIHGNKFLPQRGKEKIVTDMIIKTGLTSFGILIQELAPHSTILNVIKQALCYHYIFVSASKRHR